MEVDERNFSLMAALRDNLSHWPRDCTAGLVPRSEQGEDAQYCRKIVCVRLLMLRGVLTTARRQAPGIGWDSIGFAPTAS
jgi:hypothetical protein